MAVVRNTQPYIAKARIENIDSNTDPTFNDILSTQALLSMAQQALLALQNRGADGLVQPSDATGNKAYFRPKFIGNVPASEVADLLAYRNAVDAAIVGVTTAIKNLYIIVADANR
jgi:hypothetical protein